VSAGREGNLGCVVGCLVSTGAEQTVKQMNRADRGKSDLRACI
jgi:hypothetical protein